MGDSTSNIGSGSKVGLRDHVPPKLKTYGFATDSSSKCNGCAIAIIVGIGGLAVGAAGLAGYSHVGALSNMAQVDAIIMMAAGGGGGTILLIIGVVGTVKNRQSSSIDTHSVYGPDAWKILNVEVLDGVPSAPQVDRGGKDTVLLYIPQRIRFHDKEQDFTLNALKEISGDSFGCFNALVKKQFGNMVDPGWVLIDRTVIPKSRNKNYDAQKKMVEKKGYNLPSVLEAVALNLMVFAITKEKLYGQEPLWTYTRCIEKVDGEWPVVVGGFGSKGLDVNYCNFNHANYGAACALRLLVKDLSRQRWYRLIGQK